MVDNKSTLHPHWCINILMWELTIWTHCSWQLLGANPVFTTEREDKDMEMHKRQGGSLRGRKTCCVLIYNTFLIASHKEKWSCLSCSSKKSSAIALGIICLSSGFISQAVCLFCPLPAFLNYETNDDGALLSANLLSVPLLDDQINHF